jgi:hypothetical protein
MHAKPLLLCTNTCKVVVYAPAAELGKYTPPISILLLYVLCEGCTLGFTLTVKQCLYIYMTPSLQKKIRSTNKTLCTEASLYAPYSLLLISNKFWMGGGEEGGELVGEERGGRVGVGE